MDFRNDIFEFLKIKVGPDYISVSLYFFMKLTDLQWKQSGKKTVSGKKVLINTTDLVPGIYIVSVHSGNEIIYQTKVAKLSD